MDDLEIRILALRTAVEAMPDCVERTIAARALAQARGLLSRDYLSAADAYYRALRVMQRANEERKAS